MKNDSKNILIIDDHRLFADGLGLIMSRLPGPRPHISTVTSVREALSNIKMIESQDLILVDLHMPSIDGFGFLEALNTRKIRINVIVISAAEKRADIERALKLGAKGFIPKHASSDEMLSGVQTVLRGGFYVPEHLVGAISWPTNALLGQPSAGAINTSRENTAAIRPRQMEVLKLIHQGQSNAGIATILGVSESAIKGHVSSLFKLLNVKNRTACVRVAIEIGILKT